MPYEVRPMRHHKGWALTVGDVDYMLWAPKDGHGWRACWERNDSTDGDFREGGSDTYVMELAKFPNDVLHAFMMRDANRRQTPDLGVYSDKHPGDTGPQDAH